MCSSLGGATIIVEWVDVSRRVYMPEVGFNDSGESRALCDRQGSRPGMVHPQSSYGFTEGAVLVWGLWVIGRCLLLCPPHPGLCG